MGMLGSATIDRSAPCELPCCVHCASVKLRYSAYLRHRIQTSLIGPFLLHANTDRPRGVRALLALRWRL